VRLESITTPEAFTALCPEWNSLLMQNATHEVFLSWQWQYTWWEAYCPGDLWIVTARDEDDTLVGLAPWFVEAGTRTVRTIGCVEVTDYLDVLVAPAHQTAFFESLTEFVVAQRDCYTKIDLCNIPTGAPILDYMPRLLTSRGFSVRVIQQEICPHIPLPGDFEVYLEKLDKKQRHELRRKLRRAESAPDEKVDWYIVGPNDDLETQLETFITLMAASHPAKATFMSDPANAKFFRAVVPRMAENGWLQLAFLTVNGDPAAAYLNFDFAGRVLVYNSGLKPGSYGHLSPGIVLLCRLIEHAIREGRHEFDFLRGTEEYKYRMGAQDRPVMLLEATLS
jgi:CelD/BcsL family acetyltransferase involved in cellulose biosynthesis